MGCSIAQARNDDQQYEPRTNEWNGLRKSDQALSSSALNLSFLIQRHACASSCNFNGQSMGFRNDGRHHDARERSFDTRTAMSDRLTPRLSG